MPIFTIALIIFVIWLAIRIKRARSSENESREEFWEREQKADLAPNLDISNLPYITIPIEKFPLNFEKIGDNDEIQMILDELSELNHSRLLNLNGKTNTDLKLEYGPRNLSEMQAIADRFSRASVLLTDLSKCCMESGDYSGAAYVLEYGSEIGSDISSNYTLLGECYKKLNEPGKLSSLISHVSDMDFLMKRPVLDELKRLQSSVGQAD